MVDRGGYMESVEEIPEPHAFTAHLNIGGESYAVEFRGARTCHSIARSATTICAPP